MSSYNLYEFDDIKRDDTYFEENEDIVPNNLDNYYVPDNYIISYELYKVKRRYNLTFLQKIFVLFEDPNSCLISKSISIIVALATALSIALFIISSVPEALSAPTHCSNPACYNSELCPGYMICEPQAPPLYSTLSLVCLYIFVIDYFPRFFLCSLVPLRVAGLVPPSYDNFVNENGKEIQDPVLFKIHFLRDDPVYPTYKQFLTYLFKPMNLIDLVAVLPFFFAFTNVSGNNLFIIRILRLARVLRILKLGKNSQGVKVITSTMYKSSGALSILGFFTLIGVILFASIIYYFESGDFIVTSDSPYGAYYTRSVDYIDRQKSLFTSILVSIYWACTTVTTVGYGDYVPTTYAGRFVAILAMYSGVFVLALPISIIGNNFSKAFDAVNGGQADIIAKCITNLTSKFDITTSRINANEDSFHKPGLVSDIDDYVLSNHKAKKFSSLLLLTKCMCKVSQQKDFIAMLQKKGFDNLLDKYNQTLKIRKQFRSSVSIRLSNSFSPTSNNFSPTSSNFSPTSNTENNHNASNYSNITTSIFIGNNLNKHSSSSRRVNVLKRILEISKEINEITSKSLSNNVDIDSTNNHESNDETTRQPNHSNSVTRRVFFQDD